MSTNGHINFYSADTAFSRWSGSTAADSITIDDNSGGYYWVNGKDGEAIPSHDHSHNIGGTYDWTYNYYEMKEKMEKQQKTIEFLWKMLKTFPLDDNGDVEVLDKLIYPERYPEESDKNEFKLTDEKGEEVHLDEKLFEI